MFLLQNRLDIKYFEELSIGDYFKLSKSLFNRINEEKKVEDYYSMYLTLTPLMIRKEIEWKSFKEFLEENNATKKVSKKETTKTNKEILDSIKNINFD